MDHPSCPVAPRLHTHDLAVMLSQRLLAQVAAGPRNHESLWQLQAALVCDDAACEEAAAALPDMALWSSEDRHVVVIRARLQILDRWLAALCGASEGDALRSFAVIYPDAPSLADDLRAGAWDACPAAVGAVVGLGLRLATGLSWGGEWLFQVLAWLCRSPSEAAKNWGVVLPSDPRPPADDLGWEQLAPLCERAHHSGVFDAQALQSLLAATCHRHRWRGETGQPAPSAEGRMTQDEAAQVMGLTQRAVRMWISDGRIPPEVVLTVGRRRFLQRAGFMAWHARNGGRGPRNSR